MEEPQTPPFQGLTVQSCIQVQRNPAALPSIILGQDKWLNAGRQWDVGLLPTGAPALWLWGAAVPRGGFPACEMGTRAVPLPTALWGRMRVAGSTLGSGRYPAGVPPFQVLPPTSGARQAGGAKQPGQAEIQEAWGGTE